MSVSVRGNKALVQSSANLSPLSTEACRSHAVQQFSSHAAVSLTCSRSTAQQKFKGHHQGNVFICVSSAHPHVFENLCVLLLDNCGKMMTEPPPGKALAYEGLRVYLSWLQHHPPLCIYTETAEPIDCAPCGICGRTFNPDVLVRSL